MSPVLILSLLVAALVALLPVWRLHVAGWPTRWLATAWILYTLGILVAVRLPIRPARDPDRRRRVRRAVRRRARAGDARPPRPPDRAGRGHRRDAARRAQGEPEPPRHVEGEVIDDDPGPRALSGPIALHGGGEYVTGDERAMDALLAAARAAAGDAQPVVVIVPTAAARQRPEQAAAHGERAFRAAAARAGLEIAVGRPRSSPARMRPSRRSSACSPARTWSTSRAATRTSCPRSCATRRPGRRSSTPSTRDACLAGASAGAMALGERVWTSRGGVDGLGLLPGIAVIPHFVAGRLEAWRSDRGGRAPAGVDRHRRADARHRAPRRDVVGRRPRPGPPRAGRGPRARAGRRTGSGGPHRLSHGASGDRHVATRPAGRLSSPGAAPDVRPLALAARPRRLVPQPRVVRGVPGARARGPEGLARADGGRARPVPRPRARAAPRRGPPRGRRGSCGPTPRASRS